jgi:hypothetical protein
MAPERLGASDRPIGRRLQPKVRERAGQFRETAGRAVRASWAVGWLKSILFSTCVGLVLGLVGAFGTNAYAFFPRMLIFGFIGMSGGLIVAGCVWAAQWAPFLAARPLLRRVVIALVLGALFGVWVWLVIGFIYMGRPRIWALPLSLAYSLSLTGPMSVLSWLIFRPRHLATPASSDPPKFLQRLPVRLRGGEIYAIQAEDHYLRLHTSKGSDLILMRLSDAIAELDGIEGAQVHRSWWVAKSALADVKKGDGRAVLKLKDGVEAPVSRTYLRSLREAGWF